jgi:uncharacterized protein (DUF924 family)
MDTGDTAAAGVLDFWFGEIEPRQWFAKDPVFDGLVRDRFIGLSRAAIGGELDHWADTPSQGLERRPMKWCNSGGSAPA